MSLLSTGFLTKLRADVHEATRDFERRAEVRDALDELLDSHESLQRRLYLKTHGTPDTRKANET